MTTLEKIKNLTWWNFDVRVKDILSTQQTQIESKISIDSPNFTGIPTAPTPTAGTNTTQIATTEFVLANSTSESSIDTSFLEIIYSSVLSVTYDSDRPNIEIHLTGNLDLTITGTSSGDSGMANLYFSAAETATLNGVTDLVITGTGEMIPVYFIHDSDGLKWYNGVTGGVVDTSLLALQDGTILYHTAVATNVGTVTSSGNNWTGTGTAITNEMVGAKITVDGQTTTILTIDLGAQTFTTNDTIVATDKAFEIRCIAYQINSDGSSESFYKNGNNTGGIYNFGDSYQGSVTFKSNGNVDMGGYQFKRGNIYLQGDEVLSPYFVNNTVFLVSELQDFTTNQRAYASVSDAASPSWHGIAVGGGTTSCPVYWNGTNWIFI